MYLVGTLMCGVVFMCFGRLWFLCVGWNAAQGMDLHAVLLLQLKVLLVQGVDTVNHDLDKLDLRVAETVLVRDVIGAASLATGFSPGSSGLDGEFLAPLLQSGQALLGPSGQVNVHGGAHASA